MRSTTRSLLVAAAALALLTGCAEATPAQTAAPTSTPAATPTATPTSTPTPTPSATSTAAPSGSQLDFADGTPCADATAIDPESVTTISWGGTYEEQLAQAELRTGFEPTGMLAADGILCSLSYRLPLDGEPSTGDFSVAYVRDASVPTRVAEWAAANGYAPPSDPQSIGEEVVGITADGLRDVRVVRLEAAADLERARRVTGVDLQPGDHQVLHRTIVPQG
ncbi:hypothetical protein [Agrococcus lahaulensis]|uniref:hypothetical protein n=1 Tax=Agrococcus lahaulensis TaxID=341722 RepID=UPI00047BB2E8|nr:hypothetical protein [Agrococcus lahaulensis]